MNNNKKGGRLQGGEYSPAMRTDSSLGSGLESRVEALQESVRLQLARWCKS